MKLPRSPGGESDAPPPGVAERLGALRALSQPESLAEARVRLERERPAREQDFAQAVSHRLAELRQLCELARHLHRSAKR